MTIHSARRLRHAGLYRGLIGPLALLTTLIVSVSANAGAVHYRWMNERGTPVHSDRPPPKGTDYEVISTNSGLKRVVSGEQGAVPLEVESRVGNEFESVDENLDAQVKKNPQLCQRARDNLNALAEPESVRMRNDQGEVRALTAKDIETQRTLAQAQADLYCD